MQLYQFDPQKKPNFFTAFKKKLQYKGTFWQNLKYAFNENQFIKYLSLGGLVLATINTFFYTSLFGIEQIILLICQIATIYGLNNALLNNEPIFYKNNSQIKDYLVKSVFLIAFYLVLIAILPHYEIVKYLSSIILFTGISGIIQAGIYKFNKQ